MKSYTDIEQSKKLAEFLAIESADAWWAERYAGRVENYEYIVEEKPVYYLSLNKPSEENYSQDTIKDVPCWSLAALLEILPIDFVQYKRYFLEVSKMGDASKPYEVRYYRFREDWEGADYGRITHISYTAGNLIDACVAMIEWLHEQKLLRL